MNTFQRTLQLTVSSMALCAVSTFLTTAARAQPADSAAIETVTVTGTSIRGVAPVGSNLTMVTPEDIAAMGATTVEGILTDVPALTGFGGVDSGTTGSGAQQALIHQLGGSASTSTLTLIDGHRAPKSGTNHSFLDPNMIPLNMIGHVDVLADGVSAVYGSDAVAGVVNFITRKSYDGVQVTGSAAMADGKQDVNASFLAGQTWATGSALFAYSFTRQGVLANTSRPWTNPNHSNVGGTNRDTFNCDPATLAPSGQSLIYTSATSGTALANATANAMCSTWAYGVLVPKTVRNNAMVKIEQNYGSNWTLDTDLLYATRADEAPTARGTLTATAFGAGAQANPFFTKPAGYTGTSTTQTIRWDADALLGPGAKSISSDDTVFGNVNLEYRFGSDWSVDFLAMLGRDDSMTGSTGTLNSSVATLGLNGTTNTGGVTNQAVPNTNIVYTQIPLTTSNALDVWNPAGANRTPAALIKQLTDNNSNSYLVTGISQLRLQAQGSLFELPAGPVKVAFGVEANRTSDYEYLAQTQNAGPTSNAAVYRTWRFSRNIQSVYAEANIPIVSAAAGIPFMQSLTFDLSGRFDRYSDFGDTENPKIAFDWRVNDDLKLRGNWSTSFVAPPEDEVGGDGTWNNTNYGPSTQNASVPVALFPTVAQMGIAGCTSASVACSISTLTGISATNAALHQAPSLGRGWGFGFDYTPSYINGLALSFTFWDAGFKGGSSGVGFSVVSTTKSVAHLLTFYPTCATQAQIAAVVGNLPSTGATPACVQFIFNSQNNSWLNLYAQGIDADVKYSMPTDSWGTFSIGDAFSLFTSFDTSQGDGASYSVLNTTGAHGSVGLNMRASLGWDFNSVGAQFFANYTGAYTNWTSPDNPIITDPTTLNPSGGGDHVHPSTTFDTNITYRFNDGYLGNETLSLNIRNIFDTKPPYFSSSTGFNSGTNSPVGRLVTLGITSKF